MPIHRHTGNILKPQVDCYLIAHGRERERKREGERDKQRDRDRDIQRSYYIMQLLYNNYYLNFNEIRLSQ